jgi:cysteinyl-tRNA synthetase
MATSILEDLKNLAESREKIDLLFIYIREQMRKNKQFEMADKIRDGLRELGIETIDTPQGTLWRRI